MLCCCTFRFEFYEQEMLEVVKKTNQYCIKQERNKKMYLFIVTG